MKKKTWILVVALIFVLLIAVGVFVGVKTEFFGLLETKETKKEEEKEQPKKENNAYRVDCSLEEMEEETGMKMDFGAHFLKSDKSLVDMDANISYDFSSFAEDMSEEEIEEGVASLKEEISEELGLSCESSVNGKKANFKCSATKEEIVSSTNADEDMLANMNYDKFLENMDENVYTCSTKEVYISVK